MNRKKILIAVLFIIMCFAIMNVLFNGIKITNPPPEETKTITTKNPDGTTTTQVIKENSKPQEELKYYDNVIDAVRNCTYKDYTYKNFSKEDILVLDENDTACVVIGKIHNGNDGIVHYKLNKNYVDNKISYSAPLTVSKTFWKVHKTLLHGTFLIKDTIDLKNKIINDLNNFPGSFVQECLDSVKTITRWGIADDERLLNLKINGIAPTKVIETKMDGDTVYFWYYKHLVVDLNNTDNIKIEF